MSFRRLISSRANAKRSTGPRTVAGKRRSSQNALRHGCRSGNLVIPDDQSRRDLDNLLQSYLSCFKPRNPAERACIDQMAAAKWRQRCLLATENRMLTEAIASQPYPSRMPENTESPTPSLVFSPSPASRPCRATKSPRTGNTIAPSAICWT